ncbi:hypothetical protein ACFQV4_29850, partial [Streptomyces thermocarboxydus]
MGWWVHQEVYRQSLSVAEEKARNDLFALVDQLKQGTCRSSAFRAVRGRRDGSCDRGGLGGHGGLRRAPAMCCPPMALSAPVPEMTDGWDYAYVPAYTGPPRLRLRQRAGPGKPDVQSPVQRHLGRTG